MSVVTCELRKQCKAVDCTRCITDQCSACHHQHHDIDIGVIGTDPDKIP